MAGAEFSFDYTPWLRPFLLLIGASHGRVVATVAVLMSFVFLLDIVFVRLILEVFGG